MRLLVDAVVSHPSLTSLDLRASGVGERGLRTLGEAMCRRWEGEEAPRGLAYLQLNHWQWQLVPG